MWTIPAASHDISVGQKCIRKSGCRATSTTTKAVPGARFGIIGNSAGLGELYTVLERVADSPTTVGGAMTFSVMYWKEVRE